MILPYTIFQEFEDNNNHKTNNCTSTMYNQLVEKEKWNIFDTSLVFIFIFRKFYWSLAVLVDFKLGNLESDPKPTLDLKRGVVVDSFDEQYSAQKKKPYIFTSCYVYSLKKGFHNKDR